MASVIACFFINTFMERKRIIRSATLRNVFIGNGYYDLKLGIGQCRELKETTRKCVMELWGGFMQNKWDIDDLLEIIRCSLIGGGLHPEKAMHLTNTYVTEGYIAEFHAIALDVLNLIMEGIPDDMPLEGSDEPDSEADPLKKK